MACLEASAKSVALFHDWLTSNLCCRAFTIAYSVGAVAASIAMSGNVSACAPANKVAEPGCAYQELASREDLDAFVNKADERVLTVVAVTATRVSACVHVFPAVVALSKSFAGFAVFGRLLYDASPATGKLAAELNVTQVSSSPVTARWPLGCPRLCRRDLVPQLAAVAACCW